MSLYLREHQFDIVVVKTRGGRGLDLAWADIFKEQGRMLSSAFLLRSRYQALTNDELDIIARFVHDHSLVFLNMNGNKVKRIPDTLCQLVNLKRLYLCGITVRFFFCSLHFELSCTYRALTGNKIAEIPESFESLVSLRDLIVHSM